MTTCSLELNKYSILLVSGEISGHSLQLKNCQVQQTTKLFVILFKFAELVKFELTLI